MTELAAVTVGGDADRWAGLGFAVRDGAIALAGLELRIDASAAPIAGATAVGAGPAELDGLAFAWQDPPPPAAEQQPNGAGVLDHIVVATGDVGRTTGALRGAGFELRGERDAGDRGRQAFLRAGATIIEVVGPATPEPERPARFWGLAFAVDDLDALAVGLGDHLGSVRDAVQPGRRIAALRREAGLAVPIAFLSARTR